MDRSRHILVTGATGFIGQHVCRELTAAGCRVTAFGRRSKCVPCDPRVTFNECDLLDADALRASLSGHAFDTLVHLAWETRHGQFWRASDNLDWVAASLQLLRLFADQGGRRIVAAGTCVEYRPPEDGPCVEAFTEVAPTHLYGVAKDAFHRLLSGFCAERGLDYAWARVFMLIGPGEHPDRLVPSVIRSLLRGKTARCTSGVQIRDFIDVRDCGSAFATLALGQLSGPVNVCSGNPVSIADLVNSLGQSFDRPELVHLGVLPDRPGEAKNLWGDATRLLQETHYRPRYSLAASIDSSIDYWRTQGAFETQDDTRSVE